jgi:site-specific recombinase XerD
MEQSHAFFLDLYMEDLIRRMILDGKKSSAETYDAALKRIRRYFGNRPIPLSKVNRFWVQFFQHHLNQDFSSENSVMTYMSVVRSVYNRMMKEYELTVSGNPFGKLPPRIKAPKPVTDIQVLHAISHARLEEMSYLYFSRDLFLFSYYAGGMSFQDMALLKKKDIQGDYLSFRRSRSGCECKVFVTGGMRNIMERYPGQGIYLFPVIIQSNKDLYKQYRSGLRKYNMHIEKLALMLQIKVPLHTPMMFSGESSFATAEAL